MTDLQIKVGPKEPDCDWLCLRHQINPKVGDQIEDQSAKHDWQAREPAFLKTFQRQVQRWRGSQVHTNFPQINVYLLGEFSTMLYSHSCPFFQSTPRFTFKIIITDAEITCRWGKSGPVSACLVLGLADVKKKKKKECMVMWKTGDVHSEFHSRRDSALLGWVWSTIFHVELLQGPPKLEGSCLTQSHTLPRTPTSGS